jgi:hypothetical protein
VSTASASSSTSEQVRPAHGAGIGIYLAFAPWVVFSVMTRHDSLRAAAAAALAASVAIAIPSLARRRPKVLELGAIVAFAAFTLVAFTADASASHDLARYARAIAAGALAAIALGSLLFTPFAAQYARESVPRQFWASPRFMEINRRLTLMWGLVFVVMVPSHLIAGAIDTRRTDIVFNWVVPVLLVWWAAKRTAQLSSADAKRGARS